MEIKLPKVELFQVTAESLPTKLENNQLFIWVVWGITLVIWNVNEELVIYPAVLLLGSMLYRVFLKSKLNSIEQISQAQRKRE